MSKLYLHDASRRVLESYKANLPQSLLLTGASGVGLHQIAKDLAGEATTSLIRPFNKKNEYDPVGGTIAVETVRELYELTNGKRTAPYIVIIDDADRMSRGAQTAFLKLLEEPRPMVHFVLTAHTPERLLPTIRSRVQHIDVRPISAQQTSEFIATLGIKDSVKIAQLSFIAGGRPAELARLAADETYFAKHAKVMGDAREMLRAAVYNKLLMVNTYQADRANAQVLVGAMITILRRTLSATPQAALIKKLGLLLDVDAKLGMNMNVRLQLTRLVL